MPAPSGTKPHLVAVGGYVGMVGGAIMDGNLQYGGGVVFRNMRDANGLLTAGSISTGENNGNYFYVNPFVGRVLDGYAIHDSSGTTNLNNTDKNYKIPTISLTSNQYFSYSTDNGINKLVVNNKEGLWLLSAIANSGASALNDGKNLGYTKGKTRVTTTEGGDLEDEAVWGGVENTDKTKSYLTKWDSDTTPVFNNLNNTAITIELKANGDFNMTGFGNGFRGIGASYATNADNGSNYRLLTVSGLNGNNRTVTLAQNRKEYTDEKDNWTSIGSGLFVLLKTSGSFTASDLILKGSTGITYYSGGAEAEATNTSLKDVPIMYYTHEGNRTLNTDRLSYVGAGMLVGNLSNDANISSFALENINLQGTAGAEGRVVVNGSGAGTTCAGGVIGALWNYHTISELTLKDCVYSYLSVSGRMSVGGFVGYTDARTVKVEYTADKTLLDGDVISTSVTVTSGKYSGSSGVGGLIGFAGGRKKDENTCELLINSQMPDCLRCHSKRYLKTV